jgi:cell division cycle 14
MSTSQMIVLRRAPWDAFYPIAEMEFMPFRDAGRGRSDFNLSIQDCLWGMWKAMNNGLCNMNDFNVEEYEYYEKVENGDWNWLTPNFIAFASPMDPAWVRRHAGAGPSSGSSKVQTTNTALQRKLPTPFLNCLGYFEEHNVKLVVRLNNPLYDKAVFEERGIEHLELYFDDGTNPTDEIVREFIRRSDAIVESGGVVAVHVSVVYILMSNIYLTVPAKCKAGLGRTGTLVGGG